METDWLAEALRDLSEIHEEADEKGLDRPDGSVVLSAERLLRSVYALSPGAVCGPNCFRRGWWWSLYAAGFGRSVAFLCEPDGGALCSVNMNGNNRQKRYSDINELPDYFARAALVEMGAWVELDRQ